MSAIQFAMLLLQNVPAIVAAGKDVIAYIKEGMESLRSMQDENRDPTTEEWEALDARISELRKDLHSDD